MRPHIISSFLLPGILALGACTHSHQHSDTATAQDSASQVVTADGLELPVVPATISEPEDMAGFIAIHFWDGLDFTDAARSLDREFMERNFVEYLSLMPAVMTSDRQEAFKELAKRSSANPAARTLIISLGEKYLNNPDSPMKNAEYYGDFQAAGLERQK